MKKIELNLPKPDPILDDFIIKSAVTCDDWTATTEKRIQIRLKPKPKWLPFKTWMRLVNMLIVIKHFPIVMKQERKL